jgi:hypothetical protein
MEKSPVTETNGRPRRAGGLLTSANVAPVVAGALALMAAGLLIGFSSWAQKVVLEESGGTTVHVHRSTQRTSGPVVVQDLAGTKSATAGPVEDVFVDEDGFKITVVAANNSPATGHDGGDQRTRQPNETRSGHLGGKHPAGTARPAARSSEGCPPRRVRGAAKEDRRQPPGHCRNGVPDALAHAAAAQPAAVARAASASARSAGRHARPAAHARGKSSAPHTALQGHAYGHSKSRPARAAKAHEVKAPKVKAPKVKGTKIKGHGGLKKLH